MESFLNRLNVILIVSVGGLVVYQWSGESRADAQIVALRAAGRNVEQRLAGQIEALRQANEDIGDFKSVISGLTAKVADANAQIRQEKARIFTLERATVRSDAEGAALKSSLAAFKAAVDSRDASIRTLLDQRRQLAATASATAQKANAIVAQYNDLVAEYQGLVVKYNDLVRRQRAAAGAAPNPADQTHPAGAGSS